MSLHAREDFLSRWRKMGRGVWESHFRSWPDAPPWLQGEQIGLSEEYDWSHQQGEYSWISVICVSRISLSEDGRSLLKSDQSVGDQGWRIYASNRTRVLMQVSWQSWSYRVLGLTRSAHVQRQKVWWGAYEWDHPGRWYHVLLSVRERGWCHE